MPRLSERVGVLQESAIRKLDLTVARQTGVHFHRLNIGQPDVPTPGPILDAIASFRPKVVAYGPASGLPALRDAAAAYHAPWSPTGLSGADVAVTVGGSEALLFAFCAVCDPGDEILVFEPYYTNYNGFATVAGATIKPIRTSIADNFALPDDATLDRFVGPRTRAVVFSNPGNPTGAVYGRGELERLVAWAQRHDLFVIADEVYRRIWFDSPPTSALELDAPEHVILIDSLSKTWSACGLRLGFLISKNRELMEKVERLGQARLGAQPLAQHAGLAALSMDEAYYEDVRRTYEGRVRTMHAGLAAIPGVVSHAPAGAFYTMVGLPVDDADAFARFLVTDFRDNGESVVVAPGGGFYADPASGRSEIRLAAVSEEAVLARALAVLGAGLAAWQERRG